MLRIYPRTREREKAWPLAIYATGGSLLAAPVVNLIFNRFGLVKVLYTFSLVLESVCILPQLLLLRQTTVPTVITSFYLVTLGSYRFFYILNWIVRAAGEEHFFDPVSVIFGVVQTALYADFAWVYWTRQRVKLRGGGVVDSDDLRKSWLVGGLLGRGRTSVDGGAPSGFEDDEEDDDIEDQRPSGTAPIANGSANARKSAPRLNRWGKRGVSVSADDTLEEHEQTRGRQQAQQNHKIPAPNSTIAREGGTPQERTGMLKQPDEFLNDGEDDNLEGAQPFAVGDGDADADGDEDTITPTTTTTAIASGQHQQAVLNSGKAWGAKEDDRAKGEV